VRRAAEVLRRFDGREQLIAGVDVTVPGLAVVRLTKPFRALAEVANRSGQARAGTAAAESVLPLNLRR
jgi:hypothetical protein